MLHVFTFIELQQLATVANCKAADARETLATANISIGFNTPS